MKKDIENNIKYILDNINNLDLSPINKEYIYKIIDLLKFQVRENLIFTSLSENEKLVKHIESVLKTLNEEEEKINKEIDKILNELDFKYDEYVPVNTEDNIFPGLKAKFEENRKKIYESEKDKAEKDFEEKKIVIEDKLNELKAEKDTIKDLKEQIVSPKSFIELKLKEELDTDTYNNNYKLLLNDCAISILGVDIESEKADKLFSFDGSNYVPNQDALLDYFEIGRNPELSNELKEFYESLKNITNNKNVAEKNDINYEEILNKREDIKEALYDKEATNLIEENLLNIHNLLNEIQKAYLSKVKVALDVITTNSTPKTKLSFLDKLLKKDTDNNSESENNTKQDEDLLINNLVDEYNKLQSILNFESNPKNSIIYDFYINIAYSKISVEEVKKNIEDISIKLTDLLDEKSINDIGLICTFLDKYSFDDIHDIISSIINSKVDEAQNSYNENQKNLNEYESKEKQLFEGLSDKAKEYHNNFGSEYSLGNFNNLSDNIFSPLIASLILETIICIDDIKTPDDIHRLGISLSDDEIKEYKELITTTILPNMENFLNNSINIILVKNHK